MKLQRILEEGGVALEEKCHTFIGGCGRCASQITYWNRLPPLQGLVVANELPNNSTINQALQVVRRLLHSAPAKHMPTGVAADVCHDATAQGIGKRYAYEVSCYLTYYPRDV